MPIDVGGRFASPAQQRLWDAFKASLSREPKRLPAGVPLDLVVAAHEWSLLSPLLLKDRSDFKAIPQITVDPYIHQVNAAVAFFRRLSPRGLIADDVGLGKTITAGLIIRELILRKKIGRFIVIAPKLILEQWQEELRAKFGLESTVLAGAEIHTAAKHRNVITTYHTAARHMDDIVEEKFDLVVLDEVHKLRNLHTTGPQMAKAVHGAQRSGAFRYALGLSATPLQNSLWDLYSIADILRTPQPNPYGDTGQFTATYLADPPTGRKIKPHSRDEFRRRTSEYMHRTSRKEAQLRFPDRVVGIEAVTPTNEEAALQREALEILFGHNVPVFARISIAQTLLSSPRAVVDAIERRVAVGGTDGTPGDAGVARLLVPLKERFAALTTSAKLQRLLGLIREYAAREPEWRIIVFTIRRATAEFIRDALLREGYGHVLAVVQGGQGSRNAAAVADFVASPPRRHLLVSTDSGAEGVNLQACNVLINFDLPWNPMVLEQRIGRIQRLGQQAERVIVRNLVTKGSVEESVVSRLFQKLQLYDATIGMAEEILGQLQEGEESIEETILNLVEQALKRRDVETMLREQEENAKKARDELERQRKEMDAVLGSTEGVSGPSMPEIQPTQPSMALEPFWRQAMKHAGWTLVPRDGGRTIVGEHAGRRPRRFTFDAQHPDIEKALLGAPGVELVSEDERPFEEAVNEWKRLGLDSTRHMALPAPADVAAQLATVLDGGRILATGGGFSSRRARASASAVLRVNVSVYHDQFEKLVRTGEVVVENVPLGTGSALWTALASEVLAEEALKRVRSTVIADPDVTAFERFYLSRRAEELERLERARRERSVDAAILAKARADIEERFTPVVEASLVAWEGEVVESAELRADLVLPDSTSVTVRLPVRGDEAIDVAVAGAIGAEEGAVVCHGGHIAASSDLAPCSTVTCTRTTCPSCVEAASCKSCGSRACPEHALRCCGCNEGSCAVHRVALADGRSACGACADTCAASGRVALRSELVRCEDTQDLVLPEYAVRSAVSGKWIRKENAVASTHSGALALASELEPCSITGQYVLPSELVTLAGTGERVLRQFAEPCSDTGEWVKNGELAECCVCARRVQPRLLAKCEVTEALGHPSELVTCAETGKLVKPDQLAVSAVSGKRVLRFLLVACASTGVPALPSELVRSEVSGRLALPRRTGRCEVTGKTALLDELEASSVSGRYALPSSMLACEVSGRRALPDEFGFCSVSGKRALRELLGTSARSGRVALKEHLGTCAVSGRVLLKSEMQACSVTGRMADPERMEKSAISGALALPSVLAVSNLSGRRVLPTETATCSETRRLLAADEVVRCEFTGETVGVDRVVRSAVSGKVGRTSLMARSAVPPHSWAWPDELVQTVGNHRILPAEAQPCPACGLDARLASDDLGERFECPSCAQVVCKADQRGEICRLCADALAAAPRENVAVPALAEAFPTAKEWRSAEGVAHQVTIGKAAGWKFLVKPRLFVTSGGRVVHERELRKGELV